MVLAFIIKTVRNVTTWKRDNFDTNGVFKQTDSYSFAQLLADETTYNIDLNKDGSVGDVIANDGKGRQTVSGSYVIDDSGLSVGSNYFNYSRARKDNGNYIHTKTYCIDGQYVVDNTGLSQSAGDSLVDTAIIEALVYIKRDQDPI